MHQIASQTLDGGAELPRTLDGTIQFEQRNGLEVRRQRTDFLDLGRRAQKQIAGLVIESSQGPHYVADIGADAEFGHPPDVDGDLHSGHLSIYSVGEQESLSSHFSFGPAVRIQRKRLAKIKDLLADLDEQSGIGSLEKRLRDPAPDLPHLSFFHSASGESGSAEADATRPQWRIDVEWDGILVDGDSGFAQSLLSLAPQHAL